MNERHVSRAPANGQPPVLGAIPTRQLVTELAHKASLLARKEVALAKREVREDIHAEFKTARDLGAAGLCGLLALQLLLVALVLGLADSGIVRGWLAALILAAVLLSIATVAGLIGWGKRVRAPLNATRRSMLESARWLRKNAASSPTR